MKLLIADDDVFFRKLLERVLDADYQIASVQDGAEAWQIMQAPDPPRLLILDYVMPKFTGPELCRKIRSTPRLQSSYLIILTAKNDSASLVCGLHAGADDYVTKPFEVEELRARLRVGERVIDLQNTLAMQVAGLESALTREKQLQNLLPICPICRGVRTSGRYWEKLELYLNSLTNAGKKSGPCPACSESSLRAQTELIGNDRS